jgi:hypothetical protein
MFAAGYGDVGSVRKFPGRVDRVSSNRHMSASPTGLSGFRLGSGFFGDWLLPLIWKGFSGRLWSFRGGCGSGRLFDRTGSARLSWLWLRRLSSDGFSRWSGWFAGALGSSEKCDGVLKNLVDTASRGPYMSLTDEGGSCRWRDFRRPGFKDFPKGRASGSLVWSPPEGFRAPDAAWRRPLFDN